MARFLWRRNRNRPRRRSSSIASRTWPFHTRAAERVENIPVPSIISMRHCLLLTVGTAPGREKKSLRFDHRFKWVECSGLSSCGVWVLHGLIQYVTRPSLALGHMALPSVLVVDADSVRQTRSLRQQCHSTFSSLCLLLVAQRKYRDHNQCHDSCWFCCGTASVWLPCRSVWPATLVCPIQRILCAYAS